MFERFTEHARQVVVLAQDESRALGHNYIGTEHLILGLMREQEGIAAQALESLGINVDGVRADVTRIIGTGEEIETGQIPFTPRAKKVLELSVEEARSLAHSFVGTEHLLLGLAREGEGVAMRILSDAGVDSEHIRQAVLAILAGDPVRADTLDLGGRGGRSTSVGLRSPLRRQIPAPRDWLPVIAAGLFLALGLMVGLLLGWGIWG